MTRISLKKESNIGKLFPKRRSLLEENSKKGSGEQMPRNLISRASIHLGGDFWP
jgi:hypothetical protein